MSVPVSTTRHAKSSQGWRHDLAILVDVINDINGGIAVMFLPFMVAVPGLIALLGLCIPLILPVVALGLVFGILSVPFMGIWLLARLLRRMLRRGQISGPTDQPALPPRLEAPVPGPPRS